MGTLKYTVGSAMASATLLMAPAAPVAALGFGDTTIDSNNTTTNNDNDSKTVNIGQCSVRIDDINTSQDQSNDQSSSNTNVNANVGGGGGPFALENGPPRGGDDGNNTNQSNSSNQSQSGGSQSVVITVSPNCSVTNVTQAAAAVQGAQVEAGKGGVSAGFGAAASSLAASVGAIGSVLGAGLGLRRFGN